MGGFYPKIGPPQRVANLLFVLDNFLKIFFFDANLFFKVFVSFRFVNYSYPPPVTVNSETKRNKKKNRKLKKNTSILLMKLGISTVKKCQPILLIFGVYIR